MKLDLNHRFGALIAATLLCFSAHAVTSESKSEEYLIKLSVTDYKSISGFSSDLKSLGLKQERISDQWVLATGTPRQIKSLMNVKSQRSIEYIQPNYKISLIEKYQIEDSLRRAALQRFLSRNPQLNDRKIGAKDNPDIPPAPSPTSGIDPLMDNQWGMLDIGVFNAGSAPREANSIVVAVIDTGVDYTHEDLLANMWRNPGESGVDAQGKDKGTNNVDDDHNGYIDDVVGWDFSRNDNKPYDMSSSTFGTLLGGGNPGHGTHCAGNVAARRNNNVGIAGVASNAQIMAIRFLSEKGQGRTSDAIKAIKYAVDNGAKVLSNSWGSEGENTSEGQENKALQDMIAYAQEKGVLFIAAAGNGHNGKGYDNDNDPRPGYPASYQHDNIISVAAIDENDQLGTFSNWGARSVDLAAPGVKVYSTMVGNRYSNNVVNIFGLKIGWDGTSMATPHVAGAAALYWSEHPNKSWKEVKAAILGSTKKIDSLSNKTTTGGKLDVQSLMRY